VTSEIVARLRTTVIEPLKQRFVERGEVIDLIALALVAGEHLFLYGPPGTAKSALIRHFAQLLHGRYFEYMLTRFSEPNEIFGPIDIVRLRQGVVATVTGGMLPEAEFVFLDELFNANSAILNNLLTVLNERVYRRGAETHRLPLLSLFSASNHLPEDEALRALFDRFLLRCPVENLRRESMPRLLTAGWELEGDKEKGRQGDKEKGRQGEGETRRQGEGETRRQGEGETETGDDFSLSPCLPFSLSGFSADDLRELARQIYSVDLSSVRDLYAEVVFKVRDLGIAFSDRRAVKGLKLLAASALLCQRTAALPCDLWVLRYVWDRAEQIAPLRTLIQGVLEQHPAEEAAAHPLAARRERVDAEDLAEQLDAIESELTIDSHSLLALTRLRERVADLADRAAWIVEDAARKHLLERSGELLKRLK
jgi:MoxR-like ATPase